MGWDGKDDDGMIVSSDIYIVALEIKGKLRTRIVGILNR